MKFTCAQLQSPSSLAGWGRCFPKRIMEKPSLRDSSTMTRLVLDGYGYLYSASQKAIFPDSWASRGISSRVYKLDMKALSLRTRARAHHTALLQKTYQYEQREKNKTFTCLKPE